MATAVCGVIVNQCQWDILRKCIRGETLKPLPVALIVDSPWIPGYLGLSTLDYLTLPEVWLEANLKIRREFPEVIFLPGFWVEPGMAAEPSAFGCKISFFPDKTPAAHPLIETPAEGERLGTPNPLTDGLMPLILNWYRFLEPRIEEAGEQVKIVAARGPLTVATHLMGVTNFLMGLKLDPAGTHRLLEKTTALVRDWIEAQAGVLHAVEGILVLDDIAGFLSLKDYRQFAHPYLKQVFDAFPGLVKMFHNDTDNPVSFAELPDLRIDLFNFTHLQSLAKVRELVGPSLCLMGNVPPLEVLVRGDRESVMGAARACLSAHRGRPGLLLSAGGGTSPGTPGSNIQALVDASRETGRAEASRPQET
ncbi:MAG TPA: uroporphyrinogen decarboxylase family protein [Candidatus Paceibacterota bacterium]|nr:uroporphyrinogen decarboxylase family protein [Verrucomicrobiota bacterium]HRY51728.1 uroporphyrinogen decarboxylase family protein [Candidatus Paceibacterota bacterium]HSA03348.1 uroporphyrinogen decarboxylase family protein [Candidatus Paceibacterota bacterium]